LDALVKVVIAASIAVSRVLTAAPTHAIFVETLEVVVLAVVTVPVVVWASTGATPKARSAMEAPITVSFLYIFIFF
jgi:hypothetical protein